MSQKSQDRRRQIAEAAVQVMQAEGYAAVTARKVAAAAGLSLGHITYNFSGMDEVLSEAYRLVSARLRAETQAKAAGRDVRARLAGFLAAGFTEGFLQLPHLRLRIDLWSAAMAHPAIADTDRALYAAYRRDLEAILTELAAGGTAQDQVPVVADTIMAALDGLWLDWARRQDTVAVQRSLEMCAALAEQVLAPRGA